MMFQVTHWENRKIEKASIDDQLHFRHETSGSVPTDFDTGIMRRGQSPCSLDSKWKVRSLHKQQKTGVGESPDELARVQAD